MDGCNICGLQGICREGERSSTFHMQSWEDFRVNLVRGDQKDITEAYLLRNISAICRRVSSITRS